MLRTALGAFYILTHPYIILWVCAPKYFLNACMHEWMSDNVNESPRVRVSAILQLYTLRNICLLRGFFDSDLNILRSRAVCCAQLLQSCLTLCDQMDCSLPGSSVHGIPQARILEWVAISFSRRIFPTQGSNLCILFGRWILKTLSHLGSSIAHNECL